MACPAAIAARLAKAVWLARFTKARLSSVLARFSVIILVLSSIVLFLTDSR
jgi:hypothetical protein